MMFESGIRQRSGQPFGSPILPQGMPIREDRVCPCVNKDINSESSNQAVFAAGNNMPLGLMNHGKLPTMRSIHSTFGTVRKD